MKKILKGYTTEIAVEKTVAEIQKLLVQNGAKAVAMEYDTDGFITDIFFRVKVDNMELPFRLPAKPKNVYIALYEIEPSKDETSYANSRKKQAERVAWRICKIWLEAQLTLINLDQAKIQEVFMPYLVMPGNKSLYEIMEGNQFMLPSGKDENNH